jgi:virginiamycin B lyase
METSMTTRNRIAIFAAIVVLAAIAAAALLRKPAPDFVEYPMPVASDIPTAVAAGPDKTVWFTIDFSDAVGMIRDGKLQRIAKPKKSVEPVGIGVDAQGVAWFTDPTEVQVSSIRADGTIKSYPLGTPIARLARLAVAGDGTVWFAESTSFSFTSLKDGQLKRHVPKQSMGAPYGMAVDAQGNAWGTLQSANQIVKIAPSGQMSDFEIPSRGAAPSDIAVDKAGRVWFLEFRTNKIGSFADGKFTEHEVPGEWGGLTGLTIAPDGAVWFGLLRLQTLGRLKDGQFKMFKIPRPTARPYTLSADSEGNIWYADISGYVGMLRAEAAAK